MPLKMRLVRQCFPDDGIRNPAAAARSEFMRIRAKEKIQPGMRIAVAVGSRGINHYTEIVAAVITSLCEAGAEPFIVPAMGSHAGGTAESQRKLLEHGGFSEKAIGASLFSSMETIALGTGMPGHQVFFDKYASEADALVVINRVKPHTDFYAPVESGLAKMLVVGLGKRRGAAAAHRAFYEHGFYPALHAAAELILSKVNLLFGLAIVENERHEPIAIQAVTASELFEREKELLSIARLRMPRLPFRVLDLLIVDEMGKDISGSGMDPNVLGRKRFIRFSAEDEFPKPRFIYVRSLTRHTHGNATGIGFAEFVRDDLCKEIDYEATYTNCLTSGTPYGAAIPMRMKDDRSAIQAANTICGPEKFRVVRIRNTLALEEMWVSEDALSEIEECASVQIDPASFELTYDEDGNLDEMYSTRLGG